MLHIAKQSDRCCCTCEHWHGIRVREDDGHIYALENVEAVCAKLWDLNDTDQSCSPLTLPTDSTCTDWNSWRETVSPENSERGLTA